MPLRFVLIEQKEEGPGSPGAFSHRNALSNHKPMDTLVSGELESSGRTLLLDTRFHGAPCIAASHAAWLLQTKRMPGQTVGEG